MRSHFGKIWDYFRFGPAATNGRRKTKRSARLAIELLEDRCTPTTTFVQTNLVSDITGLAQFTDTNLKNAWGLAYSPSGPFFVADGKAGVATSYNGQGQVQTPIITIPLPAGGSGSATPTGIVFNSDTTAFIVTSGTGSGASQFLF